MTACGMAMQFMWRTATLTARLLPIASLAVFVPLSVSVCAQKNDTLFSHLQIAAASLHFTFSAVHLFLFQHVDFAGNAPLEMAVTLIGAWVYIFTPFNLTDGRTRWRYTFGYGVEFAENVAMLVVVYWLSTDVHQSLVIASASVFFAVLGILFMVVYYTWCHPTVTAQRCRRRAPAVISVRPSTTMAPGDNAGGNHRLSLPFIDDNVPPAPTHPTHENGL